MESENLQKLPKSFKKKWLKALRSGKYQQGKGSLRNQDNTYCCLGVAAHVAGCQCITDKSFINNEMNSKKDRIRGITKVPEVLRGEIIGGIPIQLANMNDQGKTFNQIADFIEKEL